MNKLILIGAGGHSQSCIDVIEKENKFQIFGLIDLPQNIGHKVLGYEVIDEDKNIEKYISPEVYFLITIGQIKSPLKRQLIYSNLKKSGANIATIISPLAYVSKYSTIGHGSIIMHNAIINAGASVGENCIINTKALVEHNAIVENHCHLSTGAIVNGSSIIKEGSFIGSNAVVVDGIVVKESSFIKAGSLVK